MKITPLDIQQQQFKGKFMGGLDPEDVDTFLQTIAQEMEELIRENTDLKEQVRKAAANAGEMERREKDLRETMLAAQKVTEEMVANAQKESTLRISEAEVAADKILSGAHNDLARLRGEIQEMKRQKIQFETGFKSLLESHQKMLSLNEE